MDNNICYDCQEAFDEKEEKLYLQHLLTLTVKLKQKIMCITQQIK